MSSTTGDTPPRGIRVICRFRPQNKIEDSKGGTCCVTFKSKTSLSVKDHDFEFDRVFDGTATQKDIYNEVQPAVQDLLEGYNATIFAYGQTSSGKTHTMQGPDIDDPDLRGVIPRVIDDIFDRIAEAPEHLEFTIRASYLEIYLEKIRDLLDPARDNLQVREDPTKGIFVQGQKEVFVCSKQEVYEVIHVGQYNRAVSATGMNNQSSRSHSVFLLAVSCKNNKDNSTRSGKLYLVDLAGSEKVGKTGASGTTLEEAKMINKSLSALGNVIKALTETKRGKAPHIPYRDSKLTRLLQESLGGNARTTLIINCSPSSYNEEETLSTLRFGTRAKTIVNKATANVERSAAELKALLAKAEAEIARLKGIIAAVGSGNISAAAAASSPEQADSEENKNPAASAKILEMSNKIEELEKQIESLNDEKKEAMEAKEAIRDELEQKRIELEKKLAKLTETDEEKARLEKELDRVQNELLDTQSELSSSKYKITELSLQVDGLKSDLEKSNEDIEKLKQKHEEEIERLRTRIESEESLANSAAVTPSASPSKLEDRPVLTPSISHSTSAANLLATASARWDATSDELRENLQRGFARIRELDSDLFGSSEEPSDEKVWGAMNEIAQLADSLSVSPSRTPAPLSPYLGRLSDADEKPMPVLSEPIEEPEVKSEEKEDEEKVEEEEKDEEKEDKGETTPVEEQQKPEDETVEEKKSEAGGDVEQESTEQTSATGDDVTPSEPNSEEVKASDDQKEVNEEVSSVTEPEKVAEGEGEDVSKPSVPEEEGKEEQPAIVEEASEPSAEEETKKEEPEVKEEEKQTESSTETVEEKKETETSSTEEKKEEVKEEKKEKNEALMLASKSYEAVPHPEVACDADANTVRSAYSVQLELANKEIANAEATRARLKQEIESMMELKDKMRAELNAIKEDAERKLKELEKTRSDLESDIENRCSRVVSLQQQLSDMEEKYNAARKERHLVDARKEKKFALHQQRELQKATRVVMGIERERDKLREEANKLRIDLQARLLFEQKQDRQINDLLRKNRELQSAKDAAARAAAAEKPLPVAYGMQAYQIRQQQQAQQLPPLHQPLPGQTHRGKLTLSSSFADAKVSRAITGGGGGVPRQ